MIVLGSARSIFEISSFIIIQTPPSSPPLPTFHLTHSTKPSFYIPSPPSYLLHISSVYPPTASLLPPFPLFHPHGMYKLPTRMVERYVRISQESTIVRKILLYTYDNNNLLFIWSYSIWVSSNDCFLLTICCLKGGKQAILYHYIQLRA